MFQNRGGGTCGPPPVQQWEIAYKVSERCQHNADPGAGSGPRKTCAIRVKNGGVVSYLVSDQSG